jgi:hypothetical protein
LQAFGPAAAGWGRNRNLALITHDDGLRHRVDLAKKAPAELHLFENAYYAESINVVLVFSAEAIGELAGRLG